MKETKKIKVLQGIRQGKIGGGESYLLGLVENMDRSKFEPVVLSFTEGPMIERLKSLGIQTKVIYTEKPFDVRVWKKVANFIQEEEIDIVHAHGTRAMSNMFQSAKSLKRPLLYTCHAWSFHLGQNPVIKKIRVASEKYLTSKANINICGAKANRDEAKKLFGNFSAEIIYNSVDPQKFNPHGTYKNIRADLGIADSDIVIASVARFTLQKQPLKLIAAFAAVCKQVDNLILLMVGEGEQKEKALQLVKQLGVENKVIFEPFRQDVPDVLSSSDIFVLPSLWEAFPIALLEAMSMGKAVIATNVDGTPEMIENGYNGIMIEVNDLQNNLEKALTILCTDKQLRHNLGSNAVKSVYNKYNVSTLAKKNEALYEQLA